MNKSKLEKLKSEYQARLTDTDAAIKTEKRILSLARKRNFSDAALEIISERIQGLGKTSQAYVQILHDLDDIND